MKPLRMCMVCRERAEKDGLVRVVKQPDGKIVLDLEGKLPGRGGYLCKEKACLLGAQKRRVLERAFSQRVELDVYQMLAEVLADEC